MSKTDTVENIRQDESDGWGYMGCRGIRNKRHKRITDFHRAKGKTHLAIFSYHIMVPVKAIKTECMVTSGLQKTGQSCYLLTGAHGFKPSSIHI